MNKKNQSISRRYENKRNTEIGVKLNRDGGVFIIIQENVDQMGVCKIFKFDVDDQQTLQTFEIIFNNILNYHRSFEKNYGLKRNESKKSMGSFLIDSDNSLIEVCSERGVGITFRIVPGDGSEHVSITFDHEDYEVLSQFKTEFTNVVNNNVAKLPAISSAHHADVSDNLRNKI